MLMDIRDLRESRRLRLGDIYLKTGIDIGKLSCIERDLARPTAKQRESLALLYDVNPEKHLPIQGRVELTNDEGFRSRAG